MKRATYQRGCLFFERRTRTWNLRWRDASGIRRSKLIGSETDYPTKAAAEKAADPLRQQLINPVAAPTSGPTVNQVYEGYRDERMPKHESTRRGYTCWFDNHVLPVWGEHPLVNLKPRPVQLWLDGLKLEPKSKLAIRSNLSQLFEYAMWADLIPLDRNPMSLVTVRMGFRRRKARVLTFEEFHRLLECLTEPYRTMAIVAACLGLRISETLGLQWSDLDWLNRCLLLQRAVVKQITGDVKTRQSGQPLPLDEQLLEVLKSHRQRSAFTGPSDWVFASPESWGKRPRSYSCVYAKLSKAGQKAGIGHIGTHTFRHSYRSWLDALHTPLSVQQRAMRHADIRQTMQYGDLIGDELRTANAKVVGQLIGPKLDREAS
jgi:integrase